MPKDILVSIMSDDIFARNWMSLLVVRDWRSRLVAEMNCQADPFTLISQNKQRCDFLIVDLDTLRSNPSLLSTLNNQDHTKKPLKIIGISSRLESRFLTRIKPELLAGYLIKDEIGNSLGWAITFAAEDKIVFTPITSNLAFELSLDLSKEKMILKKRVQVGITDRQEEIARLAIIYSVGRRDLADELKISDQWSYSMVSELYDKLGIEDLFSGEETSLLLLQDDPKITRKLDKIIDDLGTDGIKSPRHRNACISSSDNATNRRITIYWLLNLFLVDIKKVCVENTTYFVATRNIVLF